MSDRMHPIPFARMLDWTLREWQENGSVFGCHKVYQAAPGRRFAFAGHRVETPIGPAAGPHTQLAQNIAAAYLCGGRIMELKTVQQLDGEDLHVSKPCILAEDEGYNCEWSTELTVPQAFDEYVKAWFLLHLLAKELELGEPDGFVFNMSVGYDLAGIQSPKIDRFIEGLKDASGTDAFRRCREELLGFLPRCARMTAADVEAISPCICDNIAVSTMHGCPAGETEKIARYLLEQKRLGLYLKCNPTLLGYEAARGALDGLGFGYMEFDREQFDNDLQYRDAVPMLRRLWDRAGELGLFFGVKLTNTFPVRAGKGQLPDEMMYMSGRALLPLSLGVAEKLSADFDGRLPVSYCGGANAQNAAAILATGIGSVTVCTDLLKPGGYHRLHSMAVNLDQAGLAPPDRVDAGEVGRLARTLCGPASRSQELRRGPVPEQPDCIPGCKTVCGSCATLCPNRANVVITAAGRQQLLHLDGPCNECGNCASFCPDKDSPYREKLTLFCTGEELRASRNSGFAPEEGSRTRFLVRWRDAMTGFDLDDPAPALEPEVAAVIRAVVRNYPYLMYR